MAQIRTHIIVSSGTWKE